MSKTKIVVVKLKELILTTVLVLSGVLLLTLLIILFATKDNDAPAVPTMANPALYYPGVYSSSVTLNDTTIHLELVCDSNHINSVRLVNLDEAIATMYPLLSPALADLELQLVKDVSPENLAFTEGRVYTQTLLAEAISETLEKARVGN